MKRFYQVALCCGVAALAACGTGSGGSEGKLSFLLTYCDADNECEPAFQCQAVYCADKCLPDGTGKCVECNHGKKGTCLPRPAETCAVLACKADETCEELCTGACDAATGQCLDVACEAACVPAPAGCKADADCASGFHCETYCPNGCSAARGEAFVNCGDAACLGRCVQDPPAPKTCDADAECGDGFRCEPVMCPMLCASDGKGGCLPCNGGHLGVCVQAPTEGCKAHTDCKGGEACVQYCTGVCDAFSPSCDSRCFGQCVPQIGCAAVDCGPGYTCEEVCGACEGGAAAKGAPAAGASDGLWAPPCSSECVARCVPVPVEPGKCNSDADCAAGTHCETVYCAMMERCIPDEKGGCMDCNDGYAGQCVADPVEGCSDDAQCAPGETCRVYCMGACDPAGGCKNACQGVCIPAQQGCQADTDCSTGYHCEQMCAAGCTVPAAGGSSEGGAMPCYSECYGQCVQDAPQPAKCNTDAECGPGSRCEPVYCTMGCGVPADGAADRYCAPCNDGYLGQCTPVTTTGCQADADCAAGEQCQTFCMGLCDPTTGCTNPCSGVCVPKAVDCQADADCGAGKRCELMCTNACGAVPPASGEGAGAVPNCVGSECHGQCVDAPTGCAADSDCPAGQICLSQTVCPPCAYAEPACGEPCAVVAQCVAIATPR